MVRIRPSLPITTPLPRRSVPRAEAVKASAGISVRIDTTADKRGVEVEVELGRVGPGDRRNLVVLVVDGHRCPLAT